MHLLDGGYVGAEILVTAQAAHQIALLGPPLGSYSHQCQVGQGYDLGAFLIEWETKQARCPQGQASVKWTPGWDVSGGPVVRIRFHAATWRACPVRPACTQAKEAPRQLTVRPQVSHAAIQAARQRQETAEFKAQYARRARVEGRTPRASDDVACDTAAIGATPKRMCSTSSPLRPLTSCGGGVVRGDKPGHHQTISFCGTRRIAGGTCRNGKCARPRIWRRGGRPPSGCGS
jgi:hypothetical protein